MFVGAGLVAGLKFEESGKSNPCGQIFFANIFSAKKVSG